MKNVVIILLLIAVGAASALWVTYPVVSGKKELRIYHRHFAKDPDEPKWKKDHPRLFRRGAVPKKLIATTKTTWWSQMADVIGALGQLVGALMPLFSGGGSLYLWLRRKPE
jgi:hypothetical protein